MKKIIALIVVLTSLLTLVSCGNSASVTPPTTIPVTEPPTVPITEAPATEPEEIHWEKGYYIDEFGDSTGDWYLRGTFEGSFSNSATSGSDLTTFMFCDKDLASASYDSFFIRLIEYGSHIADFSRLEEDNITVKIKVDGVVYQDNPYYLVDGCDLYFRRGSEIFEKTIDALNAEKTVSYYIEAVSPYGTTIGKYRFVVDAAGLSGIPHNWKGKM